MQMFNHGVITDAFKMNHKNEDYHDEALAGKTLEESQISDASIFNLCYDCFFCRIRLPGLSGFIKAFCFIGGDL